MNCIGRWGMIYAIHDDISRYIYYSVMRSGSPKLLVICQMFYPELISTGQTLTELCEELVKLGVEIEVLCAPMTLMDQRTRVLTELVHNGIRIRRVWSTRFPKLNLVGKIINHLTFGVSVSMYLFARLFQKKASIPILIPTNPPFLGGICAFFRFLGGAPFIYLVFDVYPDTVVNLGLLRSSHFITKLWNRWNMFTFKYASIIVVIGRCMKTLIEKKIALKDSSKMRWIHVWSDDTRIQSATSGENPTIKKWNLHGKFVVCYSGNIGRFHDMETIMEAVKALNSHPEILFLFIGEGYKKKVIIDYALKYGLTHCQFHSYVPREELGSVLSCSNLGLVSLLPGQEGLSVPSKTYGLMAAGIPVIGILPEHSEIAVMIREEKCGIVIRPGDTEGLVQTILSLYTDHKQRQVMGQNGKKAIAEKYTLHHAALEYKKIIHQLL